MLAEHLNYDELLELTTDGGVIQFAGQRALLLDALAMGLLRQSLVDDFGATAARTVLTRFGFAHGWRLAERMKGQFKWDADEDWRRAGFHIHTLHGLFARAPGSNDPLSEQGAMLLSSYEAEQHLFHFGRSAEPSCWTICGLVSGYLSRSTGKEIYVLEDRCLCKGDAACHLFGRTREEWGDAHAEELRFFDKQRLAECLDVSLLRVTETLNAAERKLRSQRQALVQVAPGIDTPNGIVAKSESMSHLVDLARRVAKVDATVLITGESGSGKERIARLVHEESQRASGPFIAVSCGAITESLLESELFGHVRGAFTGATHDRPGLFEAANGGTLLLDEIGEVSPAMQVKLLRVLQEREVRRVGENMSRRIDVRVVAATNRDLVGAITAGTFREDLFYRLKVVELRVPALRERKEDILPLARVLLAEAAIKMKRKIRSFTAEVADQLVGYHWPGNVRELQNVTERAIALARGTRVVVADLPEELRRDQTKRAVSTAKVRPLGDIEREYILESLRLNDGNQTRTAEQLQIGSATLYRKLKAYGQRDPGSA